MVEWPECPVRRIETIALQKVYCLMVVPICPS
jgi:hypothetical protein